MCEQLLNSIWRITNIWIFLKGVILKEKKSELTCFTIAVNEEIPATPEPVKPGSSRKYYGDDS